MTMPLSLQAIFACCALLLAGAPLVARQFGAAPAHRAQDLSGLSQFEQLRA
jgi:hypothetical protein